MLAAVNGLWLVNADTDADIVAMTNGATIDLQTLSTANLNVRATTDEAVGSVGFNLSGPSPWTQTENVGPYALFGDNSGDYLPGSFLPGQYNLTVTPFSGSNQSGTVGTPLSLSFEVIGDVTQPPAPSAGVYNEENGLVVMEVENTPSDLGLWQLQTDYSGHTGDGYLQFTGNSTASGPPNSPLEYRFRINTPGLYYLHLHIARDTTHGQPGDHSNDAYVRVEGDYGAGPNAGNNHGDDAPLSMLMSDTKFFGGAADTLVWASGNRLDPGGHDNKRVAVYDFKAGEEYKLVVSGRSQWFSADRIVFRHLNTAVSTAQNLNLPESPQNGVEISGELKQWHKTTLTLDGPVASETGSTNPFLDYRMDVTFTHQDSGLTYYVPGYFAADGNAANTGATSGNKWRAHLAPDVEGVWNYTVSFRTGTNVAVNDNPNAGTALAPYDGITGSFTIGATDKTGIDNRGKGRLEYVGEHYLQYAGTGEYFIKQGPDAPENLLAYQDFDGTFKSDGVDDFRIKTWSAHVQDWNAGDPTWAGGKGKGLIGAVNYLASEELNAMSFLTMNINGDDKNVFPYTTYNERLRMDVSRLDQWEILFEHADSKGIYLHFKTQETENDQLLDGGALGNQRKLYYRELIARYSHHLALNWNLGEENTNTTQQRKDFAQFFYDNDPYKHNIVIHSYPNQQDQVYNPLLGNASQLTGASVQTGRADFANVHGDAAKWVNASRNAGKKWVVAVDEPGDAQHALRPDNDAGNSHVDGRKNALWGTLMAGGAGNEWYFGYGHAHSDLTAEDFRSRDNWWDYTRYAKSFFEDNAIPFWEMVNDNSISTASNDYGFYKAGDVYTVYLKDGGTTSLNLNAASASDTFSVKWYDPRNGGPLLNGTVTQVSGGGIRSLGLAPNSTGQDWAILVTNVDGPVDPPPPTADQVEVSAIDDAFIQNSATFNDALLRIESTSDRTRTAYLKFDVPDTPGKNITGARLYLTVDSDNHAGSNLSIRVYLGGSDNWTESNLTPGNAPAKTTLIAETTRDNFAIGNTLEFDVSAEVVAGQTITFVIDSDIAVNNSGDVAFASSENGNTAIQPKLVIDVVDDVSAVAGRWLAYGGATASYGQDAIDTTKSAYLFLPGTSATAANYTNYTRGLNRVLVDLANSQQMTLSANDFEFHVGNTNDPNSWTKLDGQSAIPLPTIVNGTRNASTGLQRFTLQWLGDDTIKNQWLKVTVKATVNTELAADDVFYFGNQIADVFGTTTAGNKVVVNAIDTIQIRANQNSAPNSVGVGHAYDIDRNGSVNAIDTILARAHQASGGGLYMLWAPAESSSATSFASASVAPVSTSNAMVVQPESIAVADSQAASDANRSVALVRVPDSPVYDLKSTIDVPRWRQHQRSQADLDRLDQVFAATDEPVEKALAGIALAGIEYAVSDKFDPSRDSDEREDAVFGKLIDAEIDEFELPLNEGKVGIASHAF